MFINVRPAAGAKYKRSGGVRTFVKASQRGAKSPNDPFYWRFLEFGTSKMRARPFLRPAADKLPEALSVFEAAVIPAIEKFSRRKGPA